MESVEEVGMSKWKRIIELLDRKQPRGVRQGIGETKEGWGTRVNKQDRP